MWTITILFNGGGSVNLIYDDSQRALSLHEKLHALRNPSEDTYDPQVAVEDEYGTRAVIDIAEVICHTLQDVRRAQTGAGELQLLNMKTNVQMQQKAQRDPTLRLAMPPQGLVS